MYTVFFSVLLITLLWIIKLIDLHYILWFKYVNLRHNYAYTYMWEKAVHLQAYKAFNRKRTRSIDDLSSQGVERPFACENGSARADDVVYLFLSCFCQLNLESNVVRLVTRWIKLLFDHWKKLEYQFLVCFVFFSSNQLLASKFTFYCFMSNVIG